MVASSCICAYSFHSLSHLHRNSTASTRPPMCESVAFRPSLVSHSKSDAKRQKVVTDVTIGDRYVHGRRRGDAITHNGPVRLERSLWMGMPNIPITASFSFFSSTCWLHVHIHPPCPNLLMRCTYAFTSQPTVNMASSLRFHPRNICRSCPSHGRANALRPSLSSFPTRLLPFPLTASLSDGSKPRSPFAGRDTHPPRVRP